MVAGRQANGKRATEAAPEEGDVSSQGKKVAPRADRISQHLATSGLRYACMHVVLRILELRFLCVKCQNGTSKMMLTDSMITGWAFALLSGCNTTHFRCRETGALLMLTGFCLP